ncbi:MAG TPA: hypothetical protein VFI02_05850 [Armatimonadota bacterium]|nr:hypothetical protein [Armatimonadota bacterium]
MASAVTSKNGIAIRLTDERWAHITEEHSELAGLRLDVLEVISDPERIVQGGYGSLLAVRQTMSGKFLVVVYREHESDGFIITAFLTSRISYLDRRKQLWP